MICGDKDPGDLYGKFRLYKPDGQLLTDMYFTECGTCPHYRAVSYTSVFVYKTYLDDNEIKSYIQYEIDGNYRIKEVFRN